MQTQGQDRADGRARDHRIQKTGNLLDGQGRLREAGFACAPPFLYNREDIAAPAWRIKDWDYYLVNDGDYALALTFSDLGYLGLVSASVMDFAARTFKTTSEVVPFTFGSFRLPRRSSRGDISWSNSRCRVEWRHVGAGGQARRLSFSMACFDGDSDLEAELFLDREPADSMVIATPWAEDPVAFYYNQKIIGMRARGGFRAGGLFHEFDASDALGLLDWGRGVWTYENTWYWAAAQGYQDGRLVGLNLLRLRRHLGGQREHGLRRRRLPQAAPRRLRDPAPRRRNLRLPRALAHDRRRGAPRPRLHSPDRSHRQHRRG